MLFSPIKYNEPVFRPPAEAYSAILQITLGCSWNKCAFCEMYTTKIFSVRKFEAVQEDIKSLAAIGRQTKKLFLADGNALVLSAKKLMPILEEINLHFPKLQRISCYALPSDIAAKSLAELKGLRAAGLKLLYVGIESGNDELLELINKSEDYKSTALGVQKAHEAGIDTSIMVVNGLGGKKYAREHALASARLVNDISPKFLSTLTLSLPFGQPHFERRFKGEYIPMTIAELAEELKLFISQLKLASTIFRSDHVSNQLVLKGRLPADKDRLLRELNAAIIKMDTSLYPPEPGLL